MEGSGHVPTNPPRPNPQKSMHWQMGDGEKQLIGTCFFDQVQVLQVINAPILGIGVKANLGYQ
jgi:hypothetical protein